VLDVSTPVPPAFCSHPDRVGSYGDEAAELAAMSGRILDPEQRQALDVLMGYDRKGSWTAFEGCIIIPRQNGKTGGILVPMVLWDMFLGPPGLIVWTAHRFKTTQEAFLDFKQIIARVPEFSRRILRISEANGEEAIELKSGTRLNFLARSKTGGRGMSGKRLVGDEAFALEDGHLGTLIPTMAAIPNSQVVYASSACLEGSEVLRRLVERGRAGGDPSLAYIEWCSEPGSCRRGEACTHSRDEHGCQLDDLGAQRTASPALGRRILVSTMAAMRRAMSPAEFAREFLGWHDKPVGSENASPISVEAWAKAARPGSLIDSGRVVLAVDCSWNLRSTTIAVGGETAEGLGQIELIDFQPGTDWVPDTLARLLADRKVSAIAVDGFGPVGALVPLLQPVCDAANVELHSLTGAESATAAGMVQEAVCQDSPRLVHLGDDHLAAAIAGAARRDRGDGAWVWGRKRSDVDICPLIAATEVFWGISTFGVKAYDLMKSFG